MIAHSNNLKEEIPRLGKEYDVQVIYEDNNDTIILGNSDIYSIDLIRNGDILKSLMKELDLRVYEDLPIDTKLHLKYGLKINNSYKYLDYGYFYVTSSEKEEDNKCYKLVCYDKMINAMVDYEDMNITYPITIRDYLSAICTKLGITFANVNDTFPNYNKEIASELYLDSEGGTLAYTYRDVLTEIAEATGSIIRINKDDELEVIQAQYVKGNNLLSFQQYQQSANGITISVSTTGIFFYGTNDRVFDIDLSFQDDVQLNGVYKLEFNNSQVGTYPVSIILNIGGEDVEYALGSKNKVVTIVEKNKKLSKNFKLSFKQTHKTYSNYLMPINLYEYENIDKRFIKDDNVSFKEKFGPINTIVFSRSNDTDNVYYPDPLPQNPCELKIKDNQILNGNDRADYLEGVYNALVGLEYYANEYDTFGIGYLETGDGYYAIVDDNIYPCLMTNSHFIVRRGVEESIDTPIRENTNTDYEKANKSDREETRANLIVNKQLGEISMEVGNKVDNDSASIILAINGGSGSSAEINASKVSLAGKQIALTSENITIASTNFNVDKNGNMICANATITGGSLALTSVSETSKITITDSSNSNCKIGFSARRLVWNGPSGAVINITNILDTPIIQVMGIGSYAGTTNVAGPYVQTPRINAGNIDAGTGSCSSAGDTVVYFNKTFANVPKVVATPTTTTNGVIALKISEITTTYFKINIGGTSFPTAQSFNWIAIDV